VIRDPGPRRERLLDVDLEWLEAAPGWWLVAGAAVVAALVTAVLIDLL